MGHGIGGAAPYFGDETQFVLFGGFEIGQGALSRFYTLHVLGFAVSCSGDDGRPLLADTPGRGNGSTSVEGKTGGYGHRRWKTAGSALRSCPS